MSQTNMAMNSGVRASLYPTVTTNNFCKVWFKSFLSTSLWENYVAFFSSKLWSYKKSSWIVDWESALTDLDVNEQVPVLMIQSQILLCQILFLTKQLFVTIVTLPRWRRLLAIKWFTFLRTSKMTQDIFQLLHACDKCTHEAAFFQNILGKFLKIFQKFCTFLTKNPTHTLTF